MKLSEILNLQCSSAVAQRGIQSNYGFHLGYIGNYPAATAGAGKFLYVTAERFFKNPDQQEVTEYDGIWIENDCPNITDESALRLINLVWGIKP